jgi:hypothetical protein
MCRFMNSTAVKESGFLGWLKTSEIKESIPVLIQLYSRPRQQFDFNFIVEINC